MVDKDFRIQCGKAILGEMLMELKENKPITKQMVESCLKALTGESKIPTLKECGFRDVHKQGFII